MVMPYLLLFLIYKGKHTFITKYLGIKMLLNTHWS